MSIKATPLLLFICAVNLLSGTPLLVHVADREGVSLNGAWNTIIDPYEVGFRNYRLKPYDQIDPPKGGYFLDKNWSNKSDLIEYGFDKSPVLQVPGDWNSQADHFLYYEGSVWYRRLFDHHEIEAGRRAFLHFGGANYEAHVYLNGRKLGSHIGGFTPFQFEVTEQLRKGENSLVVLVNNNRRPEAVPTIITDWWNYGGITRDVTLYDVPAQAIADYQLKLDPNDDHTISIDVEVDGATEGMVDISIAELDATVSLPLDSAGRASGTLKLPGLVRWSPENPRLYSVSIQTADDLITESIGFRRIETRDGAILLNGEPIFLRGISLHEENPLKQARVTTLEESRMLLTWAKELGCNFVRLAHYPHNVHMAREADRLGLLIWEEVPVYWTIHWENLDTLANAKNQLTDLIKRDRNRASVIVWSVANETPLSDARLTFLKDLISTARELDSTRLVSAAMEKHSDPEDPNLIIVDDPLLEYTDLASFNTYIGWYGGVMPDACAKVQWRIKSDKPVLISEFGGGALQGNHGEKTARYTEEYQAWLYEESLPMLERIPNLAGMTPWTLVDFRSPGRLLPEIQDGWNRKGIIGDNGLPKAAYFVLKEYYEQK